MQNDFPTKLYKPQSHNFYLIIAKLGIYKYSNKTTYSVKICGSYILLSVLPFFSKDNVRPRYSFTDESCTKL